MKIAGRSLNENCERGREPAVPGIPLLVGGISHSGLAQISSQVPKELAPKARNVLDLRGKQNQWFIFVMGFPQQDTRLRGQRAGLFGRIETALFILKILAVCERDITSSAILILLGGPDQCRVNIFYNGGVTRRQPSRAFPSTACFNVSWRMSLNLLIANDTYAEGVRPRIQNRNI
jgi:hypothetical protein